MCSVIDPSRPRPTGTHESPQVRHVIVNGGVACWVIPRESGGRGFACGRVEIGLRPAMPPTQLVVYPVAFTQLSFYVVKIAAEHFGETLHNMIENVGINVAAHAYSDRDVWFVAFLHERDKNNRLVADLFEAVPELDAAL